MTRPPKPPAAGRLHTIGAVCERLRDEFPDISISKIRYLEDQGLLQPSRTRGGYRLFAEADVERLVTILRLQRDEFLPLRVIREELDAPSADRARRACPGPPRARRRRSISPSCASAPASRRSSRASSRSTACCAAGRGGRAPLPRERGRHRRRVRADRAARDRRAAPAGVPHRGGPPVGAARAGRRAGAALARPPAARRVRSTTSRRSPASRRSWPSCCCCATSGRWPTDERSISRAKVRDVPDFPNRGDHVQGRDAADRGPRRLPRDDRPARRVGGAARRRT